MVVDDTSSHAASTTGNTGRVFGAIQALTAATLDQSGMTDALLDDFDGDLSIPAGVTVYGRFPTVQLTTGTVIAYYGT